MISTIKTKIVNNVVVTNTRANRILFIDIETAPNLAFVWGMWKQNVIAFNKEWYILSFAAKWSGGKMMTRSLPDYPGYVPGSEDDRALVQDLWKLFDEADIIIAHNGDNFDIKKANTRFLIHGMMPPSPYKTVDTLKELRKHFSFNSNKLDYVSQRLGVGSKMKTTGFGTWKGCMEGNLKSWKLMVKYNCHDVVLLEKDYLILRPWITSHPNMGVYTDEIVCTKCGADDLKSYGFRYSNRLKYRRLQCLTCGGWSRQPLSEGFKARLST